MKRILPIISLVLIWPMLAGAATFGGATIGQATIGGTNVAAEEANVTNGLVGWWKFDDGSGTTAIDSTGNGYTGTLNGTTGWTSGHIGPYAISYPGISGSGISISPTITTGTTFTYAAWIYIIPGGASYQNLFAYGSSVGFWIIGGKLSFYYGTDHLNNTSITSNAWHHIAVVDNAGAVTFYLDGSADGTAASGPSFVANGMGADYGNSGEYFEGYQDDVRIYNRALTTNEITTIYNYR